MFEVTIDLSQLENFQNALVNLPERVQSVLVETMKEAEDIGLLALTAYPESPTPPINWDSEKQRRAFWATNGFGGGIPHERQGALPGSFEESEVMASAGLVEGKVFSPEQWVEHVMSPRLQSAIHAGRWSTDSEIGQRITPEIVKLFSDALLRAVQEGLNNK